MARTVSEHFDAQKELILDGAVEVFATEGFAQTSKNRIAERACISKSLIYHYYPGKKTLLFEAMLGYPSRLSAEIASVGEQPCERKRHRLLQEYRVARFHHMILMNEVRNLLKVQQEQVLALQKAVVDDMRAAIECCLPGATGEDLKAVTMLVFGMVNWIHTWYSESGPVSHAKLVQLVDIMVCGAMRGLANGAGARSEA